MDTSENPPDPPTADAPNDRTDGPLGWPADRLIGYREFAELVTAMTSTRVAESTLRKYASIGLLCEPDEMLADRKRWRVDTARTWQKNRKGRGAPGHERASRRKAD